VADLLKRRLDSKTTKVMMLPG